MQWVKEKDFPAPDTVNEELPAAISAIISKCLEPNPEDRPTLDEIKKVLCSSVTE